MSIRLVIIASLSTPPKFWLMCSRMLGYRSRTAVSSGSAIAFTVLYGASPAVTPPASSRPTRLTSACALHLTHDDHRKHHRSEGTSQG